jgi:hypothetical protein
MLFSLRLYLYFFWQMSIYGQLSLRSEIVLKLKVILPEDWSTSSLVFLAESLQGSCDFEAYHYFCLPSTMRMSIALLNCCFYLTSLTFATSSLRIFKDP